MRDTGRHLDADTLNRMRPAEDRGQGRGPILRVCDARRPARGPRTPGGVGEDRVHALGSQLRDIQVHDVAQANLRPLEITQIRGHSARRLRVDINRENIQAQARNRQRVRADPAAQIRHPPRPRGAEALRVARRHHQTRRLLQPVAREHHV